MRTPLAANSRRNWRRKALALVVAIGLAALLGPFVCRPSPPRVNATTLCALAEEMSRPGGADALLAELARETGTPREEFRLQPDGAYAPYWHFFVEEAGIFVARPGVVVLGASGDPSFRQIDRCVYAYDVKG